MDEAQYLAKRVAVIAGGTIVAEGPPSSLAGRDTAATIVTFRLPHDAGDLPPALGVKVVPDDRRIEIRTEDPTRALYELTRWAVEQGLELEGLHVTRPTLEDVYLEITRGTEVIAE
jgi:ABC-2 type transport system ATP-binding protein